jgi:hypothetical protein
MSLPVDSDIERQEFAIRDEDIRRDVSPRSINVRRMRSVSNWSLAAILVGTGVTSAAFAGVLPGQRSAITSAATGGGSLAHGCGSRTGPAVSGPVAASGGSPVAAAGGSTGQGSRACYPSGYEYEGGGD